MKNLFIILIIFLFFFNFSKVNAESQKHGFQLLKVGVSASMNGKGNATTAAEGDASIIWYNPAGTQICSNSNFSFSYNNYIFDNKIQNASIIFDKRKKTYGLGITFLNYGRIEKTDQQGNVIGEYHPFDLITAVNYAQYISPSLAVGVNLKFAYEKIGLESSLGFATDLGVIYDSFFKGLNLAFVIQNIGFSSKLKNKNIDFPLTCRIGANYKLLISLQNEISLSSDLIHYFSESTKLNLGVEYNFAHIIYTRLGYNVNYDAQDFSSGIGIKLNKYNFDYSFTPYKYNIGNAHCFSVSYNF